MNKIIHGNIRVEINKIADSSIDLIVSDPPYQEGFTDLFDIFKQKLKPNGQILWFAQPTELYDLPEKPMQLLIWKEPYSPKPIRKKYREFLDVIAWYAYGDYTFNKLLWNLMNSIFEDVIIRDKRIHKWEKPLSLFERLVMVHTNKGDTILDPFAGSGNLQKVASDLNREYIGIEIEKVV